MPRDTLTAPLILPLACTSDGSRTSTISTLPRVIRARASGGGSRGTAALASASISLTLDGMVRILLRHECAILPPEPIPVSPPCSFSKDLNSLSRAEGRVDPFGLRLLPLVAMADAFRRHAMAEAGLGRAAVIVRCFERACDHRHLARCGFARLRWEIRRGAGAEGRHERSEEHTSELQSPDQL